MWLMNYDAFVYEITCSLPERFLMIYEKAWWNVQKACHKVVYAVWAQSFKIS